MYIQAVGGLYYQMNLTFVFKWLTHMLSDMFHYNLSQLQWQLAVQHTTKLVSNGLDYVNDTDVNIQSGAKFYWLCTIVHKNMGMWINKAENIYRVFYELWTLLQEVIS
jgi:hypothetical protein